MNLKINLKKMSLKKVNHEKGDLHVKNTAKIMGRNILGNDVFIKEKVYEPLPVKSKVSTIQLHFVLCHLDP